MLVIIPAYAIPPDPALCDVDYPPHIIVTTNNSTYYTGDTIYVYGIVCDYSIKSVYVSILDPYTITPIAGRGEFGVNRSYLEDANTFSASFNSGGGGWKVYEGDYRVKVSGDGYYVEETFEYIITDEPFVTVTTDKSYYVNGETIVISGEVRSLYPGTSALMHVMLPDKTSGGIFYTDIIVGDDKQFSTKIIANSTLMNIDGEYQINVQYGSAQRIGTTTFNFGISTLHPDYNIILSDGQLNKADRQLTKWHKVINNSDIRTSFLTEKLDEAIFKNQPIKIAKYTELIGNSMAVNEMYKSLVEFLEEQIILYS